MSVMTKQEYIEKVKQELHRIPEKEKQEALEYLEEYFLDAQESEQEVIENLGSPEKYAAMIQADMASSIPPEIPKKKESSIHQGWTILLGIFALPLAIPAVILVFVFVVVALSLVFALIVTILALIVSSVFGLISLFSTGFELSYIGVVLMMIGNTILGICLLYVIGAYGFPWMTKQLGKVYQKLKNKEK